MSTKQYYSIRFLANVWLWAESPSNENRELTEEELEMWSAELDRLGSDYIIYRVREEEFESYKRVEFEDIGGRTND